MGDRTASKFVKWLNEEDWRLVIGMIFSGELGTSFIGSWVATLAIICYIFHIEDALKKTGDSRYKCFHDEQAKALRVRTAMPSDRHPFVFKTYSDDGIAGVPHGPPGPTGEGLWKGLLVLTGPTDCAGALSFRDYLVNYFDLELKPGSFHHYDRFFVEVAPNGEIKKGFEGPTILHRFFLKVVFEDDDGTKYNTIGAFRPLHESAQRLYNSINPTVVPETLVAKVVGSMYDTQGMNPASFKMMENELGLIRASFWTPTYDPIKSYEKVIREIDPEDLKHHEWLDDAIAILKKSGYKNLGWQELRIPTYGDVIKKYLRTSPPRPFVCAPLRNWHRLCELGMN